MGANENLIGSSGEVYRASASVGGRLLAGTLKILADGIHFEGGGVAQSFSWQGLQARRGGHNNEQIFFESQEHPGWSLFSSDERLYNDPVLRSHPEIAGHLKAVEKSRKKTPLPVKIGIAFGLLILLGLIGLWLSRGIIIDYIANKIPLSWEQSYGERVWESVRTGGEVLEGSKWEEQVNRITDKLTRAAEGSGHEFRFHIMQDTNVNAFALPGGHIVILTGLLEAADSGEEVAGVLGHEMGHVTHRHHFKQMLQSAGVVVLLQALVGDSSGAIGLLTQSSGYLLQQKFSRDAEREADDAGLDYMVAAGINPEGAVSFFNKLKEHYAQMGMERAESALSWVSTHPATQERIDRLQSRIDRMEKTRKFQPLPKWEK